ncbi:uncharacterized protein LOC135437078 [Drosophila montana]|uniref:uncharacterized protein LOC135437078 n=1 Tax=Drosophila montana TaxID=40370 RepID=UPI00313EF721
MDPEVIVILSDEDASGNPHNVRAYYRRRQEEEPEYAPPEGVVTDAVSAAEDCRRYYDPDPFEEGDQPASKHTAIYEPVTDDEGEGPLFRRRFPTHRPAVDPDSQFQRVSLRYLPKIPEEGSGIHSGPPKCGWTDAGEGPDGKRRRKRRRNRHRGGCQQNSSIEGTAVNPKKIRPECTIPGGQQLNVPSLPRERLKGPFQFRKDNRNCGSIATARGGCYEAVVVEEARTEEEDVMPPLVPATPSETLETPLEGATATDSELWENILDLYDGIDGWDTNLESVLNEKADLNPVAASRDSVPEAAPRNPSSATISRNPASAIISGNPVPEAAPRNPTSAMISSNPVPYCTPRAWRVFLHGAPLSSGVVELIEAEMRFRRGRSRRFRFHVTEGDKVYGVTLNAKGSVTVTSSK